MAAERLEFNSFVKPARGLWQLLVRLLQLLGQRLERWDQLARQRQLLMEMDDRLLKDIGLSRADAEQLAGHRPFWDDPLQSGERVDWRYRSSDKFCAGGRGNCSLRA